MATVTREGNEIEITLSPFEIIEGFHGSVRLPLSAVKNVDILDDALSEVRGMSVAEFKVVGSYIPGSTAVGTFGGGPTGGLTLAVVHNNTPRGLSLLVDHGLYHRIVLGLPDPEATRDLILGSAAS